jgi:hypothetical protein
MPDAMYDRTTQDVGNILALEHVNVTVPDQAIASLFYLSGLGFTRDPYMMIGPENMWVNIGQQQFHLPTRDPQVLRGHIGLVLPDLEALQKRLKYIQAKLAGTAFAWSLEDTFVAVTCPWGNHFRCYSPAPHFGDMVLGIPYVECLVKPGTAEGIAQFYRVVMKAPAVVTSDLQGPRATVRIGHHQSLIFRETADDISPYDGHHIAIYIADFSSPHTFLQRHNLITQESDAHQYRFQDIVNPNTSAHLSELEHEVRSLYHPLYARHLVNRNPSQNIRHYIPGHDAFSS